MRVIIPYREYNGKLNDIPPRLPPPPTALEPKNAAIINRTDGAISCILGFMKPVASVKDSVMPCIAAIVERCATTDAAAQGLIALGAIDAIVAAMKVSLSYVCLFHYCI